MTVEIVVRDAGLLAECPLWDVQNEELYWVDIPSAVLHSRGNDGTRRRWELPNEIGSVVLRASGGAVVALRNGLHTLDLESGELEFFLDTQRDRTTRYNDGKCDQAGRLWIGTLDDDQLPRAHLYRVDPDRSIRSMREDVMCSNGIDWSPDGRTLYWVDSHTHTILAFEFDLDRGEIRQPRVLTSGTIGIPDGLTVDAEGCIWCAWWDGWRVTRIAPDGRTLTTVELPVARPTSLAFGGPHLDELYVTSAKWALGPAERERQPLAGALFVLDAGVSGLPAARFGG
jgi:L-arabinonolactonase